MQQQQQQKRQFFPKGLEIKKKSKFSILVLRVCTLNVIMFCVNEFKDIRDGISEAVMTADLPSDSV